MELALEVREGGETRHLDLGLDLEVEETARVVHLVGAAAFKELADGGWNEEAARAILFVKLDPGCEWSEFTVDWPWDFEEGIPMEVDG